MKVSFIVPAYNEEHVIVKVLEELKAFLKEINKLEFEIIAVNDGSKDKTAELIAQISDIRLINHAFNKGNGAALKTGISNSSYDWIFFFDADGQAKVQEIPKLLEFMDEFDMVVGARVGITKESPVLRVPGRAFLHWLANYLSDQKIPDVNSGFRLIKKEKIYDFWNLLPNSFSLLTTLTLTFQKSGYNIKFVPITVNKRAGGKSMVSIKHGLKVFFLILRTIMIFSPFRVFLPFALFLFIVGFASFINDVFRVHITNTTVLLFVSSLLIFLFGLLADQVAAIRRQIGARRIE